MAVELLCAYTYVRYPYLGVLPSHGTVQSFVHKEVRSLARNEAGSAARRVVPGKLQVLQLQTEVGM